MIKRKKATEQLTQQTAAAYQSVREAIATTTAELQARLERMREKAERPRSPQLKAVRR